MQRIVCHIKCPANEERVNSMESSHLVKNVNDSNYLLHNLSFDNYLKHEIFIASTLGQLLSWWRAYFLGPNVL